MKNLLLSVLLFGLFSCNNQNINTQTLQNQIDSLKTQLNHVYKPGFGFLMTNIQAHHAKLWFAGINENWKLAQFEVKELKEITDEIQKYQKDRKETELMSMLEPGLVEIERAVSSGNLDAFKKSYTQLTIACNECHKLTDFEYNTVKVPETLEFSNQEFKLK
jgi:hypothetical protein